MSIQTTPTLGEDGKPLAPEQANISRLVAEDSALKDALSALQKESLEMKERLSKLEHRIGYLEAAYSNAQRHRMGL